jgi:anoctamin-10
MPPHVDLVINFRASTSARTFSKDQVREDAAKAEKQYSRLLDTLSYAGLRVVGRRGEKQGHILVFVSCPDVQLCKLVDRERHSDFIHGLPTSSIPTATTEIHTLSPADRLRLVHVYVSSIPEDGGLGIVPGSAEWTLVESVMTLHDVEFNDTWVRSWTLSQIASVQVDKIRENLGDSVALYFAFLSTYTHALVFPAVLGITFYFFGTAYSSVYSLLLLLWSIVFVEYWRVRERTLSMRWGTRGSFRVEKRRAQYLPGFPWWKRELRMLASVPVIALFAGVLATLLTGIFVFEAFVTQLYKGPGQKLITFSPTILFMALVPSVLAIYQAYARRFTAWENHAHQSTHIASLTLKTFALSAIVAYLGLALSAFIYVPFGESVMQFVQQWIFHSSTAVDALHASLNETLAGGTSGKLKAHTMFATNADAARERLNPARLQDQMFAYTVTNQIVGTFLEVGLPFILRAVEAYRTGKRKNGHAKKKRVVFEDEATPASGERTAREEREFLERVRSEVALPEYDTFTDYSEMVTQFGYVTLWSTIWPLAPVMALLNNVLELRSDAFKMTVHHRRPVPTRTDTIGPWLDALSFLTWLGALTNSALVYLFRPTTPGPHTTFRSVHPHTQSVLGTEAPATRALLASALLIALAASHGYFALRALVRHVIERALWVGSAEVAERAKVERGVKERYLRSVAVETAGVAEKEELGVSEVAFWGFDEGSEEIQRMVKDV